MSGWGAAAGNVTMNTYSAFNLTSSISSFVGLGAIILFFMVLAVMPKLIRRLIVGYCMIVVCCFVLLILYVVGNSALPIGRWLWFDVFAWIGRVLIDYGVYVVVSLPIAYLFGGLPDKWLFGGNKR